MANPNIKALTSVYGYTAGLSLSSTSEYTLLNNAVSSGQLIRLNYLTICPPGGSFSATLTIKYYPEDDRGGTGVVFFSGTPTTNAIITKYSPFYLEENMSLGIQAGTGNIYDVFFSYEVMS